MPMTSLPASGKTTEASKRPPRGVFMRLFDALLGIFDRLFEPFQRRFGVRGMAYLFVLPNLLIFGIFILFPMLLNFYYAFTSGIKLFPKDRPFIGAGNFQTLFACTNFFDPNSCQQDIFWRSVGNTVIFVVYQVGG